MQKKLKTRVSFLALKLGLALMAVNFVQQGAQLKLSAMESFSHNIDGEKNKLGNDSLDSFSENNSAVNKNKEQVKAEVDERMKIFASLLRYLEKGFKGVPNFKYFEYRYNFMFDCFLKILFDELKGNDVNVTFENLKEQFLENNVKQPEEEAVKNDRDILKAVINLQSGEDDLQSGEDNKTKSETYEPRYEAILELAHVIIPFYTDCVPGGIEKYASLQKAFCCMLEENDMIKIEKKISDVCAQLNNDCIAAQKSRKEKK